MRTSNKKALTWAIVALGIAMVVLGGVLVATFPWSQGAAQFGHFWGQGRGMAPGSGYGPWGYPHGWGFFHGPHFFGGGLFFIALLILVIILATRRRRFYRHYGPEVRLDAEEILRQSFAEGKINEEEYKSRLSALRK